MSVSIELRGEGDRAGCEVVAVAEGRGVVLVTADSDLQGLAGVEFHEKPGASGATKKAKRGAARKGGEAP